MPVCMQTCKAPAERSMWCSHGRGAFRDSHFTTQQLEAEAKHLVHTGRSGSELTGRLAGQPTAVHWQQSAACRLHTQILRMLVLSSWRSRMII